MTASVHVCVTEARAGAREAIFVEAPDSPLNPGDAGRLAADIRAACEIVERIAPPASLPPPSYRCDPLVAAEIHRDVEAFRAAHGIDEEPRF